MDLPRTRSATSRPPASTPRGASSTATTTRWRLRRDREKFDEMIDFAARCRAMRKRVAARLRARRDGARAGARVRRAAARPRLLPHRRRGVRGGERDLRAGDDAQAARDRERRRRSPSTTRPRAASAACSRSSIPRSREVVRALKRRRGGGDELLAYRDGRRWRDVKSRRHQRLREGGRRRRLQRQGLPHLERDRAGGGGAGGVRPGRRRPRPARKRAETRAVKEVARYLGNTPAVCRASYIDPRVFDRFHDGLTIGGALAGARRDAAGRCRDRSRRPCSTCSPRT